MVYFFFDNDLFEEILHVFITLLVNVFLFFKLLDFPDWLLNLYLILETCSFTLSLFNFLSLDNVK